MDPPGVWKAKRAAKGRPGPLRPGLASATSAHSTQLLTKPAKPYTLTLPPKPETNTKLNEALRNWLIWEKGWVQGRNDPCPKKHRSETTIAIKTTTTEQPSCELEARLSLLGFGLGPGPRLYLARHFATSSDVLTRLWREHGWASKVSLGPASHYRSLYDPPKP